MIFEGKWIDLEKIILSEAVQTQKNKHCTSSVVPSSKYCKYTTCSNCSNQKSIKGS